METWTGALRLAAVMGAVAIAYLIGRWVAEALRDFAAHGGLPTY